MESSNDEFPIMFNYFTHCIRHDEIEQTKLAEFIKDKASLIHVGKEEASSEIISINLFYSIFAAFLINSTESNVFQTLISQSKSTQLFQFSPKMICDPTLANALIKELKSVKNLDDLKRTLFESENKKVFSLIKSLFQPKMQLTIKRSIDTSGLSKGKEQFYQHISKAMNIDLRVWSDFNSMPTLYTGDGANRVAIDCDAANRVFISMNASKILFKFYHFSDPIMNLKYKDNEPVSKDIGELYQLNYANPDLNSICIVNEIPVDSHEYCKECKSFATPDCSIGHSKSIVKSKDLLPSAYKICLKMETQLMKEKILKQISNSIINNIIESKLNSESEYHSNASFIRVQNIFFEVKDALSYLEAKRLLEVLPDEPESIKWKEAENKLTQFEKAVFEAEKSASVFNELT